MKKTKNLSSDWFISHPSEVARRSQILMMNKTAVTFLGSIWPVSLEVASPVPSVFSFQIPNLEFLKGSEWIFRDGLVPLLWFFRKYPTPKRNPGTHIYVHEAFLPYVPEAWKNFAGTYRTGQVLQNQEIPKRILIHGVLCSEFLDLEELGEKISLLKKKTGLHRKVVETFLYMPVRRLNPGHDIFRPDVETEAMYSLSQLLGEKVSILSYTDAVSLSRLKGTGFIDLTNKHICADHGLNHVLSANGAKELSSKGGDVSSGERFVPLSINHGYILRQRPAYARAKSSGRRPFQLSKEFERAIQVSNSTINSSLPWPELFSDWVNELVKKRDK